MAESKKKELNAGEKKALFETYSKADGEHAAAKAAMEKANEKRSNAVKAISDALGIGPFNFKGRILTVVKRKSGVEKDDEGNAVEGTGTDTYYFKSPSKSEVQDIG